MSVKYSLNVKQPYARLILEGKKEIENRNYPLGCLKDEWVVLQVSRTKTPGMIYTTKEKEMMRKIVGVIKFEHVIKSECLVPRFLSCSHFILSKKFPWRILHYH